MAQDNSVVIDVKVRAGTMTGGYEAWWRVGTAQVSVNPEVEKAARAMAEESAKAKQF